MTARTITESRCSCERCQRMCETRPCLPTPEEAKRLPITMTVDFGPVQVISPAMVGREGELIGMNETGRCVHLIDGLCELHSLGLKPREGRLAHHSIPWQVARSEVVSLWSDKPVVFQ